MLFRSSPRPRSGAMLVMVVANYLVTQGSIRRKCLEVPPTPGTLDWDSLRDSQPGQSPGLSRLWAVSGALTSLGRPGVEVAARLPRP